MLKKITALILSLAIMLPCLGINAFADNSDIRMDARYNLKYKLVYNEFMNDTETLEEVEKLGRKVVFISVSDGKQQAKTVCGTGKKLETALERAFTKARATDVTPLWFKLDVVTKVEEKSYTDFKTAYAGSVGGSLRQGIAFNDYFGRALLETQINSNGWLSYETGELDLEAINKHFRRTGKIQLEKIPENLYLFNTQSYFTDNVNTAYKLTTGKFSNSGRRTYVMNKERLEAIAEVSSHYLADMVGEDGKFIYGYYPIDNEELEDYNIIRHAGTVWNLILQYDMTKDKSLIEPIEKALDYLADSFHYMDGNTAFLNDRGTLNVGGNGISLLAFVSYTEITGSTKYINLIRSAANGILFMQKENGGFTHTLYKSNYKVHKDYITVFYDGEAMYGLLRAYGLLKDKRYLAAAEKAGDYFIDNNYETLNSHWISYGFNELTKYSPEERFFNFGLKNVHGYTEKLTRVVTAAHTTNETINAAFELYHRLKQSGIKCDMLEEFDEAMLLKAIDKRVFYGMNYFVQPEQAMHFKDPQLVLGAFVVREDKFRIRIDDIQHFMGGYYLYWKNYDIIKSYTSE
ncbi:MAG: hypothetical protein IKK53_05625 [Ruminiclostridium sp.]|nr:hypothetical protein [Ruminiclostridium sp.]